MRSYKLEDASNTFQYVYPILRIFQVAEDESNIKIEKFNLMKLIAN